MAALVIHATSWTHAIQAAPPKDELRAELLRGLDEFDEAQRVQDQQPDRARRLFRSSAQRLQSIVSAGIENGLLQYNIGNAYLQAGDIGRAILHYRRAERLIPNDPLLADNLSLARSKRLTSIPTTTESELVNTAFFWHYQTTTAQRTVAAVGLYLAFWSLLIVWNWKPRRLVATLAILSALVAGAMTLSVAVTHRQDRDQPAGVVLASDVPVYKGPGSNYQRQFEQPLQPGVEFTVIERRAEWWNIELADGKTGWLNASHAELVPAAKTLEVLSS